MSHIFISHATKDDDFVKQLREQLEGLDLTVWVDSRNLRGGDKLASEIEQAIQDARQVIVVLSPNTVNSPWVRKEIQIALSIEQRGEKKDYRVIPLLLEGIEPTALELWFDTEPVAVPIRTTIGGLSEKMPAILTALGEQLPEDYQSQQEVETNPVEELVLKLVDPKLSTRGGKQRITATATLIYEPANPTARPVESRRFTFTAPLGPIEIEDLRWYLEGYHRWPVGVFKERADRIETQLPQWGQDLYQAALGKSSAQEALTAWRNVADNAERRFSIEVDSQPREGATKKRRKVTEEAATRLLALPWELLHNGDGYLFQGKYAARVRRRLPNRRAQQPMLTELPIRLLLVSPRPENEHIGYIDHRISATPLVSAIENLGELVEFTILTPPTYGALQEALKRADAANKPFDVVHFDGHGVYDPQHGLGGLCFEDPNDTHKLTGRNMEFISAEKMAAICRDYRIPVVFLEACQSAAEENPTASVAAKLLEEGVTSVVAMSHSVLVETARRFVEAFYQELAQGARVGSAMLAGQNALINDSYRGKVMGAGDLHLQDWFVPVLYQEEHDPQLFTALPSERVRQIQAAQRQLSLGELPATPDHAFIGRSRELLAFERSLHAHPYAVVVGQGGSGKTTLAVELARWLVRTNRYRRAAFVSVEFYTDVDAILDSIGHQLLPEGANWSVTQFSELAEARQPVERALRDHPTLIVLDNLETVLPDATGKTPPEVAPVDQLFDLCQKLLDAHPATRIVFTSRERLPHPFNDAKRHIGIGALSEIDAVELVSSVMKEEGLEPKAADAGTTPQEITDLVEAVNCHPRALVLLSREVARQGVTSTTENLYRLMAELHDRYPDDRENSLYASVELSLRRLPDEVRAQIKALGVFHGGVSLAILPLMGIEADTAQNIAAALIGVGLAQEMDYGYLRLNPALPPYLLGQMDAEAQEGLRAKWAEGMMQLIRFLNRQQSQDAQLAAQLTLLELPNLLATLQWVQDKTTPEQVIGLADSMERLIANLGRPQALAQTVAIRERAAEGLGEWGHAKFIAESATIDRLLERGELQSAHIRAQELLEHCVNAGEGAYQGAAYDIAMAYFYFGRVLGRTGNAEAALQSLTETQRRFQVLADAGSTSAEGMVAAAISERGGRLRALGRLDDAADAYEESIERFEKLNDKRWVAVSTSNLGWVRLDQRRYSEALEIYTEAREIFARLGEPTSVATMWHQIGMVHEQAGQFEPAEDAYRQSLAIFVKENDRANQANSLGQLGNLYDRMGRLEEAVTFYRQSADIFAELSGQQREGIVRSNIADTLIQLGRFDEARLEVLRAIECKEPFGHAAEPWKTWNILSRIETATNNPGAASDARGKAIETYLAYRKAGGESQANTAQLFALVQQAIQQGNTTEAGQILAQYLGPDAQPRVETLISKLRAILRGDRNPALAADPDLGYDDAVELQLLLESLGG